MAFFFFPEHVQIDVKFSADQALIDLLNKIVDSKADRDKQAAAAGALDASTKSLENVVAGIPAP